MAKFEDLPPELRVMIYEHVLPTKRRYTSDWWRADDFPAITLVSRLIRAESLPVWLATNKFCLHAPLDSTSVPENCTGVETQLFKEHNTTLKYIKKFEWSTGMRTRSPAIERFKQLHPNSRKTAGTIWIDIAVNGSSCKIDIRKRGKLNRNLKTAWLAENHFPEAKDKASRMVEILEECMERELNVESVAVS
jgi:hypothetical protein